MEIKTPPHILRDVERCVRCGSCKARCQTYELVREEPMSARGRVVLVGEVLAGRIQPSARVAERLFSCLLCGICEPSCPVGVKITDVVYHGLSVLAPHMPRGRWTREAMARVFANPARWWRLAQFARPLLPGLMKRAGVPFALDLPAEPLRDGLVIYRPQGKRKGRVAFYTGCSVNYLTPHLGRALIRLLFAMGYEVVLPAGEVCCGAPMRAIGREAEARVMARRNVDVFGHLHAEAVLTLCPTCTLALRVHYPAMLGGQGLPHAMDPTQFLAARLDELRAVRPEVILDGPLAWHAPCHLAHGLGAARAPLDVMDAMGVECRVTPRQPCCGFSQAMVTPSISSGLLAACGKAYGGSTIVTACPGCMTQLARTGLPVRHLVELLAPPPGAPGQRP